MRDPGKARSVEVPAARLTTDALAVATDPAVHIVCELIGGTTLAREVTLAALARGKIVVSANKALLCEHGAEIFAAARKGGGHFFFEGSVAGGIPIIKALREGLVANRFKLIYGILNGTCNYILTRMEREGASYADVLADAKRLGYAEADESLDVQGWDTAHKAAILAFLAHGVWVKPDADARRGHRRGSRQTDIVHAAQLGYGIKLLGDHHPRLRDQRAGRARAPDPAAAPARARQRRAASTTASPSPATSSAPRSISAAAPGRTPPPAPSSATSPTP